MIVSDGSIEPFLASYYVAFCLGLSELSTAVLIALANFDDEHGVAGRGEVLLVASLWCRPFFCMYMMHGQLRATRFGTFVVGLRRGPKVANSEFLLYGPTILYFVVH